MGSSEERRWEKVASAPNETVALMMQGLLRETGIPVLVQRASGFDVPDFLAARPRELLVPAPELEDARRILQDTTGLGSMSP